MCVRFSKDGQFLASCGGDKLVCIYNVVSVILLKIDALGQETCQKVRNLLSVIVLRFFLQFQENGSILSKCYPHDRYVASCAFSWSGSFFATGSNDKCVSIFNWTHHDNASFALTEASNQKGLY